MKKYMKIAIITFIIMVSLAIISVGNKQTWSNNFSEKLFCNIIELIFVIIPLGKAYFDLLDIDKED